MSYLTVRFQRWHLPLLLQGGHSEGGFHLDNDAATMRALELAPNTWTLVSDGTPIVCGGTLEQWPGRHMAWAYLSKMTAPHMFAATREAYKCVRQVFGRIEFTVRMDFIHGHRWARMLGFVVETPRLVGYGPQGEDHVGYVLLNKGI